LPKRASLNNRPRLRSEASPKIQRPRISYSVAAVVAAVCAGGGGAIEAVEIVEIAEIAVVAWAAGVAVVTAWIIF
jgi:hypothetical protein